MKKVLLYNCILYSIAPQFYVENASYNSDHYTLRKVYGSNTVVRIMDGNHQDVTEQKSQIWLNAFVSALQEIQDPVSGLYYLLPEYELIREEGVDKLVKKNQPISEDVSNELLRHARRYFMAKALLDNRIRASKMIEMSNSAAIGTGIGLVTLGVVGTIAVKTYMDNNQKDELKHLDNNKIDEPKEERTKYEGGIGFKGFGLWGGYEKEEKR